MILLYKEDYVIVEKTTANKHYYLPNNTHEHQQKFYEEVGSSVTKIFLTKQTMNCTSLSDDNIIAILLRLSKCFDSGQVCSVLTNNSFHIAKVRGQLK